jgi:Fe-S-cluster containining protein
LYREQIDAIRNQLEALLDLPDLESFPETGRLPETFFAGFRFAQNAYDRIIDAALAHDGSGERIHCTKGCSNCCIDLVRGITVPEIVLIYRYVRPWADARQVFEYHCESGNLFLGRLARKLSPEEMRTLAPDDSRIAEAHIEYNRLDRPCGFLDGDTGSCRIYPVRPLACRYFFSFDPPETCSPGHERYLRRSIRTVPLPPEVVSLFARIGEKLGVRLVNYLPGAFAQFTADVMKTRPIEIT